MLANSAIVWTAVAAIAAAASSVTTMVSLVLLMRERRRQQEPRLILDMESVRFDPADDRVSVPGGTSDNEWAHAMAATLLNAGHGTAFGIRFTVAASGSGVETITPGAAFVQVLRPDETYEIRTILRTSASKRPDGFAYEHIPHAEGAVVPLLDMRAVARDRMGNEHIFDSRDLRVTRLDVAQAGGNDGTGS